MVKRTSENQITKDDYEKLEAQGDEQVREGFQRASKEALQRRRVVKANQPTALAPPPSSAGSSKNPFAKVNLTSKTTTPPSFSFGSAAPTGGALQPKFGGFSATSNVTAAPAAAPFSFGSSTSTTTSGRPQGAAPVANNVDSTDWNEQSALLNKAYQSRVKSSSIFTDLAKEAIHYVRYCGHQMDAYVQEVQKTSASENAPVAPAPAAAAPAAFGNFATLPQPTPQPGFSFGPASNVTKNEKANEEETRDDDNDDDIPAIQRGQSDPDWDTLAEVEPVKIYHLNNPKETSSGYTAFGKGKLLLQRHKSSNSKRLRAHPDLQGELVAPRHHTSRMVMRDATGIKVLVNMKVDPSMKFTKTTTKQKGRNMMDVAFMGINDAKRGYESFRILSRADVGEQLYNKLTELSA